VGRSSVRRRRSLADLPEATPFAQKRAKELLEGLVGPIDVAIAEYVEARQARGAIPLSVTAREYALLRPSAVSSPPVSQVIDEFLVAERSAGRSDRHLEDSASRLGRFRDDFKVPMSGIRVSDVEQWLDG